MSYYESRLTVSYKKPTDAHLPVYYSYHFISIVLLEYVSTVRGSSSGSATDTFSQPDQQNVYQSEHVDPLK